MSSRPDPASDAGGMQSGVRAARHRLGLTQRQVANRMGVPLDSYKHWDREENRPSDPVIVQLLSTILDTPLDVLYPPNDNPKVARVLLEDPPLMWDDTESANDELGVGFDLDPAPVGPETGGLQPLLPGPRPALDRPARVLLHRGIWRRGSLLLLSAIGAAAMMAALALVVTGPKGTSGPPALDVASTATAQHRHQLRTAMVAAAGRHDYDAAIDRAQQLGDRPEALRYRRAAAKVLVGHAEQAASHGDLTLARARIAKARARYRTAPGAADVGAHIDRIQRNRQARAARRRAAARKRDAERAAAARRAAEAAAVAAAAARAASDSLTTPSAPRAPAAVPDPTPAPAPSGSSGSSGGEKPHSDKTVDPGLF